MDKQVKEFCSNYEVKILNDQKRRARYHPPYFFTDPDRADIIRNDIIAYETEAVLTMEIPESRLRTLVEMELKFFNNRTHERGYTDMFELLMEKEREEANFRHQNQAVKKAYEQYSMALYLAGYQRKL